MDVGEPPDKLRAIYNFCKRLLIHANVETEPDSIDTVVRLLAELREGWEQAARASEPMSAA